MYHNYCNITAILDPLSKLKAKLLHLIKNAIHQRQFQCNVSTQQSLSRAARIHHIYARRTKFMAWVQQRSHRMQ